MYASRLSKMLMHNSGTYRGASKSQVQLVHTQSIYGQINVPICEINRLYAATKPTTPSNEKRSVTAARATRSKQGLSTPTSDNRRFKPKNSYGSGSTPTQQIVRKGGATERTPQSTTRKQPQPIKTGVQDL